MFEWVGDLFTPESFQEWLVLLGFIACVSVFFVHPVDDLALHFSDRPRWKTIAKVPQVIVYSLLGVGMVCFFLIAGIHLFIEPVDPYYEPDCSLRGCY